MLLIAYKRITMKIATVLEGGGVPRIDLMTPIEKSKVSANAR